MAGDTKRKFERLLLECVESVFNTVVGETASAAIFYHLGGKKIASNPDAFASALGGILGPGSYFLEIKILETLYSRLGLTLQVKGDCTFAQYVRKAQERGWCKKSGKRRKRLG